MVVVVHKEAQRECIEGLLRLCFMFSAGCVLRGRWETGGYLVQRLFLWLHKALTQKLSAGLSDVSEEAYSSYNKLLHREIVCVCVCVCLLVLTTRLKHSEIQRLNNRESNCLKSWQHLCSEITRPSHMRAVRHLLFSLHHAAADISWDSQFELPAAMGSASSGTLLSSHHSQQTIGSEWMCEHITSNPLSARQELTLGVAIQASVKRTPLSLFLHLLWAHSHVCGVLQFYK